MTDKGISEAVERSIACFRSGYNCAEAVLLATAEYLGIQNCLIPRIATPFGGGIARSQSLCGALTGGIVAIGAALGRDDEKGDRAASDTLTGEYLKWFSMRFGSANCGDLTGIDFKNPEQMAAFRTPDGAHNVVCVPMVAEATRYLCNALAER